MPADNTQNLNNHARYDPLFHFVLVPLLAGNFVYHVVDLVRFFLNGAPGSWMRPAGSVLIAFLILLLAFKMRLYSLKVQDRVIRLEERLRLATLLPEGLRSRIGELSESQLIALRFASDQELAGLAQQALDSKLSAKDIKLSIRSWRADNFRV